ncbi:MAG: LemA family protein [Alphaproteobacteria bacterium]|nr:LemA family protein [Alphaproteobacteria bacterium]MCD8520035.1 LemA family protein [Alphaproteobacteria bacterium]MCD8569973.1 LemA family protein [Alphaproteobacteria bacterium]
MDFAVILGALGVAVVIVITIYNRLVALRQAREQAFADIDVQLKQRFDLIPNLLETVKGYAAHEKDVLAEVTEARASVGRAGNTDSRIRAEGALTGALMGLFAVAENYPDLKADANFRQFMAELSDIENKLAAARRFFNNATSEFNTAIEQFPAVLFAGALGFKKAEFFEVSADARSAMEQAPDVNFG